MNINFMLYVAIGVVYDIKPRLEFPKFGALIWLRSEASTISWIEKFLFGAKWWAMCQAWECVSESWKGVEKEV